MGKDFGVMMGKTPFLVFAGVVAALSVALLATPYFYLAGVPAVALLLLLFLSEKPKAVFYLFVFLVPLEAFTRIETNYRILTLPKIIGFGLVLAAGIFLLLTKKKLLEGSAALFIALGLFLVVNVIAAVISDYPETTFYELRQYLVAYVVVFLTLLFVTKEQDLKTLSIVIAASLFVSASLAIVGYVLDSPDLVMTVKGAGNVRRALGGTTQPNHFAAMMIFGLPLVSYWIAQAQGALARSALGVILIVDLVAIGLTYSRGGFLVTAIVTLLVIFSNFKRLAARYLGLVLAVFLVVGALGVAFTPVSYIERIAGMTDKTDPSIKSRFNYIRVAIESLKNHPFFGTGPGTYHLSFGESVYARNLVRPGELEHQRRAHNSYLEVLAGSGIAGLLCFLLVLVVTYRNFLRARSLFLERGNAAMAALSGAFALCLTTLVVYYLILSRLHLRYLWIAIALSQVVLVLAEKKRGTDLEA